MVAPLATSQRNKKSLLGQDYTPPSNEKIARRAAVKIVPASTITPTPSNTEHTPLPKKGPSKTKEEAAPLNHTEETAQRKQENVKQSEEQKHSGVAAEQAEEDALRDVQENLEATTEKDHAQPDIDDMATNNKQGDNHFQSDKDTVMKDYSPEGDTPAAEPADFFANSGRRICISSLPSGADRKDIRDLIEKRAGLGNNMSVSHIPFPKNVTANYFGCTARPSPSSVAPTVARAMHSWTLPTPRMLCILSSGWITSTSSAGP